MEETSSPDAKDKNDVMDSTDAVPETKNEPPPQDVAKSNSNGDDITQERWYAADDGSYFMERRDPFFYFNLLSYVITMGVFLYMTVVITEDFIDQQNDPPTSNKVNKEIGQPFPGMIVCNFDNQASLDLILASFETNDQVVDVSGQVQEIDCGDGSPSCLLLDGKFPAFEPDPTNPRTCSEINTLSLAVDINVDGYSNDTIFAGIDGYLFTPGSGQKITESFCDEVFPRCQTLATSSEDCPPDLSALSLDPFVASSNQGSIVKLRRSEVQSTPKCDQSLLNWSPVISAMQFNPSALPVEQSETVVFLAFEFDTPLVSKTTYNPISGQSMFGSLSGWFGFLTDGWGVISVLFFSERTFMFLRDKYRR